MKKIIAFVLLLSVLFSFGSSKVAYASLTDEPNRIDIYIDGYPCSGNIVEANTNINVYDLPSMGEPELIDSIPSGTEVTIKSLIVFNNSTNYFYISYGSSDDLKTGHVLFDMVVPVDAVITPAPGSNLEYEEPNVLDFLSSISEFIYGVIDFFGSLHNCLLTLFPFLTDSQVEFFVMFGSIFLGLGLYFLIRRITI